MTVDDLREKVIKGLKCCILYDPDDKQRCSECPYEGNCVNRLKQDALSLLKAQEEEIKQLKAMNISASDNAFACGVIHGGVTIHQKASEITNIKHVDVFNG